MEIANFQGWRLLIVPPLLTSPPSPATLVFHGVGRGVSVSLDKECLLWHLLFAGSWRWLHLTLSGRHGLKDVGSVCLPTRDTPLPFRCWVGLKHWAQSCPPLLCVRTQTALPPCGSSPPRVPSQSIFLLPLFRVLLGLLAFSRVYCN